MGHRPPGGRQRGHGTKSHSSSHRAASGNPSAHPPCPRLAKPRTRGMRAALALCAQHSPGTPPAGRPFPTGTDKGAICCVQVTHLTTTDRAPQHTSTVLCPGLQRIRPSLRSQARFQRRHRHDRSEVASTGIPQTDASGDAHAEDLSSAWGDFKTSHFWGQIWREPEPARQTKEGILDRGQLTQSGRSQALDIPTQLIQTCSALAGGAQNVPLGLACGLAVKRLFKMPTE